MIARWIFLAVLVLSGRVWADGFDYSIVGNGCMVDNPSIQNDLYENRGHGVGFKPGKSGTIRLTCPITIDRHQASCVGCSVGSSNRKWHSYTIFYKDTDGVATGTFINVQLRHANFSAPATGLNWMNTTVALPATGPTSFTVDIPDVDPGLASFWWFEVRLTRHASSTADVEFLGITLQ